MGVVRKRSKRRRKRSSSPIGKVVREQIEPALRHLESFWLDVIATDNELYNNEREYFSGEVTRIFSELRVLVGKIWTAKRMRRGE